MKEKKSHLLLTVLFLCRSKPAGSGKRTGDAVCTVMTEARRRVRSSVARRRELRLSCILLGQAKLSSQAAASAAVASAPAPALRLLLAQMTGLSAYIRSRISQR